MAALNALTTDQVTRLCKEVVKGTDCHYIGTYAAWKGPDTDEWIEKSKKVDTAFVANTDVIEKEGTHWCLFYLPADPTEPPYLFDSFGRVPTAMGRPLWRKYMETVAKKRVAAYPKVPAKWAYNDVRVQDADTTVCGQLCAMALHRIVSGRTMLHHVVPLDVVQDFVECFVPDISE
jgi:hypothetical protein